MGGEFLELHDIFRMMREKKSQSGGSEDEGVESGEEYSEAMYPAPLGESEEYEEDSEGPAHQDIAGFDMKEQSIHTNINTSIDEMKNVTSEQLNLKEIHPLFYEEKMGLFASKDKAFSYACAARGMTAKDWRRVVVMNEILSPPVALRERTF